MAFPALPLLPPTLIAAELAGCPALVCPPKRLLGLDDGDNEGESLGTIEGASEGVKDGASEGIKDGASEGIKDGASEGIKEGASEAMAERKAEKRESRCRVKPRYSASTSMMCIWKLTKKGTTVFKCLISTVYFWGETRKCESSFAIHVFFCGIERTGEAVSCENDEFRF